MESHSQGLYTSALPFQLSINLMMELRMDGKVFPSIFSCYEVVQILYLMDLQQFGEHGNVTYLCLCGVYAMNVSGTMFFSGSLGYVEALVPYG